MAGKYICPKISVFLSVLKLNAQVFRSALWHIEQSWILTTNSLQVCDSDTNHCFFPTQNVPAFYNTHSFTKFLYSWNNSVFRTQLFANTISSALIYAGLFRIMITGNLKIHFKNDLLVVSTCFKWSLTFAFPDQNYAGITHLTLVSLLDFITPKEFMITNYLASSYVSIFNLPVTSPS
jgi:hypothetical protein